MGTATFLNKAPGPWRGDARVYALDPAFVRENGDEVRYVVVSANVTYLDGEETLIFEVEDPSKNPENWDSLPGSLVGELNHVKALEGLGYEVAGGDAS